MSGKGGGDDKQQPIVVKRIRKAAQGHHGGAWKIAYADFVTAMMAFFLLMWLLGSTTKGDLKGIADYFSTPLQVALAGGSGSGDASSVINGGGESLTHSVGQVRNGEVERERGPVDRDALEAQLQRADTERMKGLRDRVDRLLQANPRMTGMRSQIRLELTRDGLRITIVDEQSRPMFDRGSARVMPYMRDLLREIGAVLDGVDNRVAIAGHTDAAPFAGGVAGYSNWELSADRANASRRELVAGGLDDGRVLRVLGLASSQPFDKADPLNPMNRRISILVLGKRAEARMSADEIAAKDAAPFEALRSGESAAAVAKAAAARTVPPGPGNRVGVTGQGPAVEAVGPAVRSAQATRRGALPPAPVPAAGPPPGPLVEPGAGSRGVAAGTGGESDAAAGAGSAPAEPPRPPSGD